MKLQQLIPVIISHRQKGDPVHIKDSVTGRHISTVARCYKATKKIQLNSRDSIAWGKYYDEAMDLNVSKYEADDRNILIVYVDGWSNFCENKNIDTRY